MAIIKYTVGSVMSNIKQPGKKLPLTPTPTRKSNRNVTSNPNGKPTLQNITLNKQQIPTPIKSSKINQHSTFMPSQTAGNNKHHPSTTSSTATSASYTASPHAIGIANATLRTLRL